MVKPLALKLLAAASGIKRLLLPASAREGVPAWGSAFPEKMKKMAVIDLSN